MDVRKQLDGAAVIAMLLICLVWSSQQVILKETSSNFSPLLLLAFRSGIAALMLAVLMGIQRQRFPIANGMWLVGGLVGLLFSLEYFFVSEAVKYTTAGHVVVFLYTSPIFAAVGLNFAIKDERLSGLQWVGIIFSFIGICVSFSGGFADTTMLKGDFFALLSGLMWGATTVVIRSTRVNQMASRSILLYQLIVSFIFLLIASWLSDNTLFEPSFKNIAALTFQSVVICFVSFLAWFSLLKKYIASQLGVLTFMTPLFGVILGAWLLHETIQNSFVWGANLVVIGIILVTVKSGGIRIFRRRRPL
ncbi:DMT family transporter [Rosenbergiella australiborealis]|uniref:Threonine/homoserine exporter RhtA n=1 Tax=Rosenbergiella australiborealis TaxID=1544696 RepID=A0ABS5T2N1_9GAMM|nr:DMT family transporter [Rosenbergiella australiborealis]MBT0726566.1 DMT family transporter [Rosenbergiella australiborealis]